MTRRDVLTAVAASPMFAGLESGDLSLAAAAAISGRFYGAAVRVEHLRDTAFARTLMSECDVLTPELALKWEAVEPRPAGVTFEAMDEIAARARDGGKRLHGHTLMWHRSIPPWARDRLVQQADWRMVEAQFAAVIGRYGGQITSWDVVNEAVGPGDQPDALRASPFLQAFGRDYVRRALDTARSLAPRARLMINDYGLEYDDAFDTVRRARFLELIDSLRAVGAPLDAVGLQSHLDLRKGPVRQETLARFLADLAARDLGVVITELDVREDNYAQSAQARDLAVAAEVRRFLDAALDQPAVKGVITWGLSDRASWLEVTQADLARWPGAWARGEGPGLNRGLPLNSDLEPTPMRQAMVGAFRGARQSEGPHVI